MIMDQAKDIASKKIISQIAASKYFEIEKTVTDPKQIEPAFKAGNIKLAVIFPLNFNNDLLQQNKAQVRVLADASDPNNATTLTNYVSSIIRNYQAGLNEGAHVPYQKITTEIKMLYNPQTQRRNPICTWCNGTGADAGMRDAYCCIHCKRKKKPARWKYYWCRHLNPSW